MSFSSDPVGAFRKYLPGFGVKNCEKISTATIVRLMKKSRERVEEFLDRETLKYQPFEDAKLERELLKLLDINNVDGLSYKAVRLAFGIVEKTVLEALTGGDNFNMTDRYGDRVRERSFSSDDYPPKKPDEYKEEKTRRLTFPTIPDPALTVQPPLKFKAEEIGRIKSGDRDARDKERDRIYKEAIETLRNQEKRGKNRDRGGPSHDR